MHYFSAKPGNFFSSVVSGKSLNLSEFSALPLTNWEYQRIVMKTK